MKVLCRFITVAIFAGFLSYPAAAQSDTAPAWFSSTKAVYPDHEYIWAIGDGDTPDGARKQAMVEMSRYFHTTVESVSKDIAEYRETVGSAKNEFSEKISFDQYSRIESNEDFFGMRFTDVWLNPKSKAYAVLAYIDRKEAEEQYHSRIETNMVGINALMADAAQSDDPLYSFKQLSKGKSIADITKKYIENMSLLNPGKSKEYLQRYTPYLNTIQQLYSVHERLRNTRISVTVEFRGNTKISETDKENMRHSVQDAIGRYNVPVQMRIDLLPAAAAGQSAYAFVFTLNSEPETTSGLIETDIVLSFTHNGKTIPLPAARKSFKEYEQSIAGGIKRALRDITDNRAFFQAIAAEINQ
ncbi:hypothetical protein FACS1894137_02320 [Spirochaetia bacterium]|nr:hypothetical protein FACS1894137_02320 [Spirochaetia bacterium]